MIDILIAIISAIFVSLTGIVIFGPIAFVLGLIDRYSKDIETSLPVIFIHSYVLMFTFLIVEPIGSLGHSQRPYGIFLLAAFFIFGILLIFARFGLRGKWAGWSSTFFIAAYFAQGVALAAVLSFLLVLVPIGVFAAIYGLPLLGAWHYFFTEHAAEPIVTPALEAGAAINHNALADVLEQGLDDAGDKSSVYYETQALKAKKLKEKLDADAEIAAATMRRERARAALLDAERDLENAKRKP